MTYSTILFDVDDTLLNFEASEKQALEKLFKTIHQPLTPAVYRDYHDLNAQLWHRYERGEISRETLLNSRFNLFFAHYGQNIDGKLYGQKYRTFLSEGHDQIPQAQTLLNDIRPNHQLYVITNGIAATQQRRLKESGLVNYFDDVFISERIGHKKPDSAFFEAVADQIQGFTKQSALVVGDSLTSDILGAKHFGIDSVWFNPHHLPNASQTKPTYEIDHLLSLEAIVS
ncbi:noncanonical pyrimidine nucleotidase, YjjG family protein [Lentilactobacillus fungorum]|uniref:Noncanonical pyrimidine nucleotidase, YjjG family protein n=1 Tax=Lentilactobacillus fungorum TaxID=2201250 RepID=A0ABQ3VYZ7_9LACO|nr:YjjG family noncanonical pyrimidine nucleotidase [Lentilactobacillus fungorum]GHP13785.1 noncanonical pyrimidine nucleotidase, YjjG family protein [Lentilactobacillus fungorum]